MPPRKKSKVVYAPIVVPAGEEKWVRFGWCSDGHHQGCRVEFPGHKCNCECHATGEVDLDEETSK